MKKYFLIIFFLTGCAKLYAQTYQGIVADSLTLKGIAGAYISLKGTGRVAVSGADGRFSLQAKPADTLVFKMVGYKSLEFPLLLQEEDLFILLSEDAVLLNGVTVRGWRLYPNPVENKTIAMPKYTAMSPFEYFGSFARERRKLKKTIKEENRSQVYRQVITNPAVKEIITKAHNISDSVYYRLLAQFNAEQKPVRYETHPDSIMTALHAYIGKMSNR